MKTHVERPQLPWRARTPYLTEYGRDVTDCDVITREELATRSADCDSANVPVTETAMCTTCVETVANRLGWDANPIAALRREHMARALVKGDLLTVDEAREELGLDAI